MDSQDLEHRFTYHKPKEGQPEKYQHLRTEALYLADRINQYCPDGREKSLAITKLEEAIFWANASIARYGT